MKNGISLKQLAECVWLLEELRKSADCGLTLSQLDARISVRLNGKQSLSRSSLTRRRKEIKQFFNIQIEAPDKKHYRIMNEEQLMFDTLANDLLASVQEYLFLDSYRDLGNLIQPEEIRNGMEFLHVIGDALRNQKKLKIRYRKFTDTEAYDAVVHPFCLKASLGRWYLIGHKESDNDMSNIKSFALDRTINITMMPDAFIPDDEFDPLGYFYDSYGVWVDKEKYPVEDLTIVTNTKIANYLRTLPLHHSQKELPALSSEEKRYFTFHISPTPDFIGALKTWGDDIEIIQTIKKEK